VQEQQALLAQVMTLVEKQLEARGQQAQESR
jgi:hypothetical protein